MVRILLHDQSIRRIVPMTFRLVALMSVVLLLSLAAFGLVMSVYQDQVMEEVARTASAVGRATLRTFEMPGADGAPAGVWRFEQAALQADAQWTADTENDHKVIVRKLALQDDQHRIVHIQDDFIEVPGGTCLSEVYEQDESGVTSVITCGEFLEGQAVTTDLTANFDGQRQLFISVEGVHTEPDDADGGLMLKIPRFIRPSTTPADEILLAKHDELALPIPVQDYDDLFDRFRSRSLFWFMGVFLVGTVLSAGVASRFTRPIRKLDAGIRKISDGDLDVEVAVQGHGEIARLGSAFNDMTRRLRENQDRSREMVRREKLSALGGLAAGVAHDVRNPLHSIGLTLQHMQETCRPETEQRQTEFDSSLQLMRGEIGRLNQLVENFLRFARSDDRARQPVDIEDLLRETVKLVSKEAEWRNIAIKLDLNASVPAISADGEELRSSILNLVLNSFEAMPEGGTLSLTLGVVGESVVVQIIDTGGGIPDEVHERVFEFGYTTRENGSGLGLAMVHQCVVENHGGRVSLESDPAKGTRVRLAIPLRPPVRETT
jgi:signal transduction histidine kinase